MGAAVEQDIADGVILPIFFQQCAVVQTQILLKREKNRVSDIDISFCQSFYKINIRNNEFGKDSVWHCKSSVRGNPVKW